MEILNSPGPLQVLRNVEVGVGVQIWSFVNLYDCQIGDDSMIGAFVELQAGVVIGRRCRIQSHSFVCSHVTIGDDVFVGHGVMFINDKHPSAEAARSGNWAVSPVVVKDRVSIGTGAIINGGVTIYEDAVVGAGALVTRDVPAGVTVAGVPARLL